MNILLPFIVIGFKIMNMSRNVIQGKNKHISISTQCLSHLPIQNLLILHQLNKGKVYSQFTITKRNEQLNDGLRYDNNKKLNDYGYGNAQLSCKMNVNWKLDEVIHRKVRKNHSQMSISHTNKSIVANMSTEALRLLEEKRELQEVNKRNSEKFFVKSAVVNNKTFKGNSDWGLSKLKLMKEKSKIRHNDSSDLSSVVIDKYKFDQSLIVSSVLKKSEYLDKKQMKKKKEKGKASSNKSQLNINTKLPLINYNKERM